MAWMRPKTVQDAARFRSDLLGLGKEHTGVQIALQCHLVAHQEARAAQVHRPVQSDRIGIAGRDLFETVAAAHGEDDAWDVFDEQANSAVSKEAYLTFFGKRC